MKTLILYLTHDGQTAKIAKFMQSELQKSGTECELGLITEVSDSQLAESAQIVLAAPIRYGHFDKKLYQFIDKQQSLLEARANAFVSINLTARKADKNTPETNAYTRKFLEKVTWKPDNIAVVAGALSYPKYNFFDRFMIRLIMKMTGGETDPTTDIEYTDWDRLAEFCQVLKQQVTQ